MAQTLAHTYACPKTGKPFYPEEKQESDHWVAVLCSECGQPVPPGGYKV